mmetsp:Transcript_267/g.505  ORF Transcript_267/g.505 Transcript_267/m.505 type:complete len:81 (-) Transcript_267:16-258(-)
MSVVSVFALAFVYRLAEAFGQGGNQIQHCHVMCAFACMLLCLESQMDLRPAHVQDSLLAAAWQLERGFEGIVAEMKMEYY